MQIVSFSTLFAVLLLAAIIFLGKFAELHSLPFSSQPEHQAFSSKESASDQEISIEDKSLSSNLSITTLRPWQNAHQLDRLIFLEGKSSAECCPSELIMTVPDGGINFEGNYVKLYNEGPKRQQFHEIICQAEVVDQPCYFMDKRFHNNSRCVQKRSYSYALVIQPKDKTDKLASVLSNTESNSYMLDYIQINSGCSCEVSSSKKNNKKNPKKKKKHTINEETNR